MVRTHGTMDLYEELPKNSSRHPTPPPSPQAPVAHDQLLDTQNALMQRLVANEEGHEAYDLLLLQQRQHQPHETSYSNFLATHPPVFTEAIDPLEVDN
jgi:hypothetical protein